MQSEKTNNNSKSIATFQCEWGCEGRWKCTENSLCVQYSTFVQLLLQIEKHRKFLSQSNKNKLIPGYGFLSLVNSKGVIVYVLKTYNYIYYYGRKDNNLNRVL